jgi:hypothetical protein
MKRLTPIEKLAREICWAGFATKPGRAGRTKARYWRSITDCARRSYVLEAERFAFLLKNVSVKVLNQI